MPTGSEGCATSNLVGLSFARVRHATHAKCHAVTTQKTVDSNAACTLLIQSITRNCRGGSFMRPSHRRRQHAAPSSAHRWRRRGQRRGAPATAPPTACGWHARIFVAVNVAAVDCRVGNTTSCCRSLLRQLLCLRQLAVGPSSCGRSRECQDTGATTHKQCMHDALATLQKSGSSISSSCSCNNIHTPVWHTPAAACRVRPPAAGRVPWESSSIGSAAAAAFDAVRCAGMPRPAQRGVAATPPPRPPPP